MTKSLPQHPHTWPEPWRSLYYEEIAEREAIMVIENASPKAIAAEVKAIESDIRRSFHKAASEDDHD